MAGTPALIPELEDVIRQGTPERRFETAVRIASLFMAGASRFNEDHVLLFDSVFLRLVVDIETQAKAELSERLAPIANAPIQLMRSFAADDEIVIAKPVLLYSPRLTEDDLIELAASKSQAHLLAISGRRDIGTPVTDVLVRRGDRNVVRTVAANRLAGFSESSFGSLVQRAERDAILAERVALRSDLPEHLFRDLLARATELVRHRLLTTAPPQTQTEIRRVLTQLSGEYTPSGSQHDYTKARQAIQAMHQAGRLDETVVANFCRSDQFEHMVAALALLCSVPVDVIERLMTGDRADPVLILCKALGFSWPTVRAVLGARPASKGMAPHTLDTAFANFERLAPVTAKRVVRFWQQRDGAGAGPMS